MLLAHAIQGRCQLSGGMFQLVVEGTSASRPKKTWQNTVSTDIWCWLLGRHGLCPVEGHWNA